MASVKPITLYRSLLREARIFPDYEISNYISRRTKEEFRKNRSLRSKDQESALAFGQGQLELVKRQSVIRAMYKPEKSVLELRKASRKGELGNLI